MKVTHNPAALTLVPEDRERKFAAIEHGPLASGRRPQPPVSQTATSLLASSPSAGCSEGPSLGHPQDIPRSLLPAAPQPPTPAWMTAVCPPPRVLLEAQSEAAGALLRTRRLIPHSQARPGPPKAPKALGDPAHPSPHATHGPAARLHLCGEGPLPGYLPLQACSLSTLLPRARLGLAP